MFQENRVKRQEYGKSFSCDVFESMGDMYVSKLCTQPAAEDLEELITLAGGNVTNSMHKASLVIGSTPKQKYMKEVWVLNCVLRGVLLDTDKYLRDDA